MAIVNITCENDADFLRGFVYQTLLSDGVTLGPPVNLTGNTMRMGVRAHASDVTEDLLLTTENGGLIITQVQLVEMQTGSYEHSLVRITGSNTLRIWSGSLVINPGASR